MLKILNKVYGKNNLGFSQPSSVSEPVAIERGDKKKIQDDDERLLKEAKATLFSSHVVDLVEAVAVSSTSIKLVWEVRIKSFELFDFSVK